MWIPYHHWWPDSNPHHTPAAFQLFLRIDVCFQNDLDLHQVLKMSARCNCVRGYSICSRPHPRVTKSVKFRKTHTCRRPLGVCIKNCRRHNLRLCFRFTWCISLFLCARGNRQELKVWCVRPTKYFWILLRNSDFLKRYSSFRFLLNYFHILNSL